LDQPRIVRRPLSLVSNLPLRRGMEGAMEPGARSLLVMQAAEILGVSRRTVYNRIREGRLRTIRTRGGSQRVLLESVESLLRERRRKAGEAATGRGAAV
jgi:excisionase family DNA binding protein